MNKYTETIQESLESEYGLGGALSDLTDQHSPDLTGYFGHSTDSKLSYLVGDWDHKLSYLYLLSIVDQETADEMIELLKEPA